MSDWTTEATDLIERTVAGVREKTVEQGYVWAAWFTLAGITFVAGLFLWSKRNP